MTKCPDFGSCRNGLIVDRIVRVYGFAPITSVASRALHDITRATSKPGTPVVVEVAGVEPASAVLKQRFIEQSRMPTTTTTGNRCAHPDRGGGGCWAAIS